MSVTIHDLARLAGVDASTVSRALHDDPRISAKTKERIRTLAEQQGDVMNLAARNLAAGKTNMVALVMDTVVSQLRTVPAAALNDVLAEHGYTLMILLHSGTRQSLEHCISKLEQKICDAAVMIPPVDQCLTPDLVRRIKNLTIPFSFLDCWKPEAQRPTVTTHVEQSIRMLMDRVRPERPEAAFLMTPARNSVSQERFQWATRLLDERGVPWLAHSDALPAFIRDKHVSTLAVFADSPWHTDQSLQTITAPHPPRVIGAMFDPWENYPPHDYDKIFLCIQNFPEIGRQTAKLILELLNHQKPEADFIQIPPLEIRTIPGNL